MIVGFNLIVSSVPTADEVAMNPNALEESPSIVMPVILVVIGIIG